MADRVESSELVQAGLAAMAEIGKPLEKVVGSKGRAMLYRMPGGQTVRIRTCNDHLLIVVADKPTADAKLNIEGTDWILLVMPEVERTPGSVLVYLLPADEVEAEARRTHREWLDTNPNTKGDNKTWSLWFKRNTSGIADDYASKWARYRVSSAAVNARLVVQPPTSSNVKTEVENARKRIASAAGVPVEAVKIIINFEG